MDSNTNLDTTDTLVALTVTGSPTPFGTSCSVPLNCRVRKLTLCAVAAGGNPVRSNSAPSDPDRVELAREYNQRFAQRLGVLAEIGRPRLTQVLGDVAGFVTVNERQARLCLDQQRLDDDPLQLRFAAYMSGKHQLHERILGKAGVQ